MSARIAPPATMVGLRRAKRRELRAARGFAAAQCGFCDRDAQ